MIESVVVNVGEMAYFEDYPILVLFNESVPEELEDVCIVHRFKTDLPEETIKIGQLIKLGLKEYSVQKVGSLANENFKKLGHISLQFGNSEDNEILPGTVVLNSKEIPILVPGDILWICVNKVDAFIESFFETNPLLSCFMVSDNRQTKTV